MENNKSRKIFQKEKGQAILIPLLAILLGLVVGGIVIGVLGVNPLKAYKNLLQGSGLLVKPTYAGGKGMITDFLSFLDALAPMLFAALAVGVALKAGLFNIGVSGQMLTAGFVATTLVGYSNLPSFVSKPLVILVGLLTGAVVGALIGFLKSKFNINEVVSSIMINYIAQYTISFFINTNYLDPVSRQSKVVRETARLTMKEVQLGSLKADLPLMIVIGIIMAIILKFLFDRTVVGYELQAVGLSPKAANYTGISVPKSIIKTMMISGGLAGLSGVSYFLGYFGSIQPRVLPSMGFDAVAVALLGGTNPIGIIFSSFFITVINKGSIYMNSTTGIETEIASVITAVILVFCACSTFLKGKLFFKKSKKKMKKGEA